MKITIYVISILIIYSCTKNITDNKVLKYSASDLVPLSDSTKSLYYKDAALIEFYQLIEDSIKKINQVKLDEDSILSYYEDLLYIYDNSYKLSNSFFERASSIHSHKASTLFQISVSVDTVKSWSKNWKNEIKFTGLVKIDSIIDNYSLETSLIFESENLIWYLIKSKTPINYISLMEKFKSTSEFIYVEPDVLIGTGSNISLTKDETNRYYKYYLGWGDCPSGCINSHYWIIELKDKELKLIDEGGDPLK